MEWDLCDKLSGFDRFQNTTINKSGIYGSYTVGNLGL